MKLASLRLLRRGDRTTWVARCEDGTITTSESPNVAWFRLAQAAGPIEAADEETRLVLVDEAING